MGTNSERVRTRRNEGETKRKNRNGAMGVSRAREREEKESTPSAVPHLLLALPSSFPPCLILPLPLPPPPFLVLLPLHLSLWGYPSTFSITDFGLIPPPCLSTLCFSLLKKGYRGANAACFINPSPHPLCPSSLV